MLLSMLLSTALMAASVPNSSSNPMPQPTIAAAQEKSGEKKLERINNEALQTEPVVTAHKIALGGKEIDYTATAGQLPVMNDAGETEARIFFVAYAVNNPASASKRPLMFLFNGGPGASAV